MTTFAQPFQDYEILDRVGGGAMGVVFKARHKKLNRIVALKVLKPSLARDKRYVERLRREARIVASLSHPHIVTGYDLGEEGGYHFFVMEFVEGKSLRQLLLEWGMFAEAYVLKVARQAAEALDHAYQRGVIHRDIKPGNILIDESGNVKLTDMGLAKGPADLTLTRDGATVGTPMYIAPEQARNPQDVDVRCDLYGLGATLYHMATGMPPFRGETMAALITSVLNDNVVPPDEANSAVSGYVSLVIRKLLAKNLTVRYQTPRELLDDLDRIERSQPPAVDVGRLDVREQSGPWARWLLYAVATLLLCGLAWWGGQQMVAPSAPEVSGEQYLRELDAELAALPSPGARFERLRTISAPVPGSLLGLEQRRRSTQLELQHAVDEVVDSLLNRRWEKVVAWLRDRATWPDQQQFEVRFLEPDLQAASGLPLVQFPGHVRTQRLDELRRAVGRELEQRDTQFSSDFEQFLATRLPALADERLRAGDTAAADRLWRDAVGSFCNGLQQPLPERLSEAVRRALRERHLLAWRVAQVDIDRAEQEVTAALRGEVEQCLLALQERLDDGVDPALVDEALQRLRDDLLHYWPPSPSFRTGHDPWPGVEQALRATRQRIELAATEGLARRFERRCDLAWRAFCRGSGGDALVVLGDCEPATEPQQRALAAHRRVLEAAVRVERAVLQTIARSRTAPVGFLLSGNTDAIELSVAAAGEDLRLVGQIIGRGPRSMRLSELRLGDLLDRLGALDDAPLREMAPTPQQLGLAALRLIGDDLDGVGSLLSALPAADRAFVQDDVWPRVERLRGEAGVDPLEPRRVFANLEAVLAELDQTGDIDALRGMLLVCNQLPAEQCTTAELRLRRRAGERLKLALRQREVIDELRRTAPRGAGIDVRVDERQVKAGVRLPASVLRGDVGDGWELRDDQLQFAGGARPWTEQPHLALVANAGHGTDSDRTVALVDLAFPSARVGRRIYLLQFRGVGLAVVLTANDAMQVALVEGDVLREDRAQRAFERALAGGLAPAGKLVVPGGVHRLTFEVEVLASRTQAMVRVELEGTLLLRQLHEVDPSLPPTLILHPLQEVAVQQVTVQVIDR